MSKRKYIVNVQEVWVQPVEIEASSEDEARTMAINGMGEYLDDFEYSHRLEGIKWDVKEADDGNA